MKRPHENKKIYPLSFLRHIGGVIVRCHQIQFHQGSNHLNHILNPSAANKETHHEFTE